MFRDNPSFYVIFRKYALVALFTNVFISFEYLIEEIPVHFQDLQKEGFFLAFFAVGFFNCYNWIFDE